jgi:hypothetical protein
MHRLVLLVPLLVAGCGSKAPATTTTPAEGTGSAAQAVLPDVPFDSLDHDQRIQFMKEKVVPTMKPIFQGHDATKFAEFGCKTCHGPGVDEGKYDMPNDLLPKLDFADMSKFKPADVEWMSTQVKPTMAGLLQQPAMSPENPKGFGCLECHTPVAN